MLLTRRASSLRIFFRKCVRRRSIVHQFVDLLVGVGHLRPTVLCLLHYDSCAHHDACSPFLDQAVPAPLAMSSVIRESG